MRSVSRPTVSPPWVSSTACSPNRSVDRVLSEPLGGAHRDPKLMSMTLKKALVDELRGLLTLTKEELLARRAERLDHYGVFTTETPKKEA